MQRQTQIVRGALVLLLGLLYGCSDGAQPSQEQTARNEVASYQQLTLDVIKRTQRYRMATMAPAVQGADCEQIHESYDARTRGVIEQMLGRSGTMNGLMSQHHGGSRADIECVAWAMLDELDDHRAAACAERELEADRREVTRHVNAMLSYADHMWLRCEEMRRGLADGQWSWSPMMSGCGQGQGACMMRSCADAGSPGGDGGGMHGPGMDHRGSD